MKRLAKNIIVVLIPLFLALLVFWGLNTAYKHTNHWKSLYNNADRFNHVPNGIQLCNLGTSHGCWGFKWEDYPELNAFNFGVSGQPFFMDLAVLNHFEDKIEPGAVVLIPVSYHQVYYYWEDSYTQTYHSFMTKKTYPFWNWKEYIKIRIPLLGNWNSIKYIWDDISEEKIDRFHGEDRWIHYLSEEEMKKLVDEEGADWFFRSGRIFSVHHYQKNFDAVSAIVDYCLERNYRPVFITVPVYEYFNQAFDEIAPYQKKGFYKFSAELCEKYPSIPYWDYSRDEDFSPHIELFMDDDHLNLYGAEKFTARVVDDLRAAGYIE